MKDINRAKDAILHEQYKGEIFMNYDYCDDRQCNIPQRIGTSYEILFEAPDKDNLDFTSLENDAVCRIKEYVENELKLKNANDYQVSVTLNEVGNMEVVMQFKAYFSYECGGDGYDEPVWMYVEDKVEDEDIPKIEAKFDEIIIESLKSQGYIVEDFYPCDSLSQSYNDILDKESEDDENYDEDAEYEKKWDYQDDEGR